MAGRKGGRAKRRKVCFFTANGITRIDYKDVDLLNVSFLSVVKFYLVV